MRRFTEEAIEVLTGWKLASQRPSGSYRAATRNKEFLTGLMPWSPRQAMTGGPSSRSHACTVDFAGGGHWTKSAEKNSMERSYRRAGYVKRLYRRNNSSRVNTRLLGEPSAIELAGIITSLGLAQNFAALKSPCHHGIQAGHMRNQASPPSGAGKEVPGGGLTLENEIYQFRKAQTLLQELENKRTR